MGNQVKKSYNYCMFFFSSEIMDQHYFELSCVNISLSSSIEMSISVVTLSCEINI